MARKPNTQSPMLTRAELAADMRKFLNNGGKVQKIPFGVSSETPPPPPPPKDRPSAAVRDKTHGERAHREAKATKPKLVQFDLIDNAFREP